MSADDYLALITSEHRHRPKFEAVVAGLAGPFVEMQAMLERMRTLHDIDTAILIARENGSEEAAMWPFPLRMSISRGASKGLDGTKATGKGSMTRIAAWCGFPTTRTEPS